ncbi:MAG: polyphosphate polymerase domain-containing protein [Clostridium sp.]|jgi:hypothetical protein|nr:polyphosphate polymerase domain-containing protein [Clostridium sp.]
MQSIFKRYEKKYLITREQYDALQRVLFRHMERDSFGEYLVQNLYFDTENWNVVRASIEKPLYKEKMRLRCYGVPDKGDKAFLELKKKYKGIVYKRRVAFPVAELHANTISGILQRDGGQIADELAFHLRANGISERVYISYHRIAFAGRDDEGLRVTFDANAHFRLENLDFIHPGSGLSILPQDKMLMEVKTLGGMPLWLSHALCENGVFPASFSKFGQCYTNFILTESQQKGQVKVSA